MKGPPRTRSSQEEEARDNPFLGGANLHLARRFIEDCGNTMRTQYKETESGNAIGCNPTRLIKGKKGSGGWEKNEALERLPLLCVVSASLACAHSSEAKGASGTPCRELAHWRRDVASRNFLLETTSQRPPLKVTNAAGGSLETRIFETIAQIVRVRQCPG